MKKDDLKPVFPFNNGGPGRLIGGSGDIVADGITKLDKKPRY